MSLTTKPVHDQRLGCLILVLVQLARKRLQQVVRVSVRLIYDEIFQQVVQPVSLDLDCTVR